jgi:hypothetical protein
MVFCRFADYLRQAPILLAFPRFGIVWDPLFLDEFLADDFRVFPGADSLKVDLAK